VSKLLNTIRKLEISLLLAHCEAAKSDPVFYAGLTLSSTELVTAIARISPVTQSKLHLMPHNLGSIFKRNFSVDDLVDYIKKPHEVRLHEGVPEVILQLQLTQQRLLFLYREMVLIAPAVACALLKLERKEVNRIAEIEQSDIALIDTIKALWVLPFKKTAHVERFEKATSLPLSAQFALDF
jgi:hypothetical protein